MLGLAGPPTDIIDIKLAELDTLEEVNKQQQRVVVSISLLTFGSVFPTNTEPNTEPNIDSVRSTTAWLALLPT